MLVGYVSNERYVALPGVLFEFRSGDSVTTATSTISGAVHVEIEPGDYEVVIGREGYGSKIVTMTANPDWPEIARNLRRGETAARQKSLASSAFVPSKMDSYPSSSAMRWQWK